MKKQFFLSIILLFIGVALFAQSDTLLTASNAITQGKYVISASVGHDLTWQIMLYAAVLGAIVQIIYTTYKGVKNPGNGTPVQFMFAYWVKDNILPKIVSLLTLFVSFGLIGKLPAGIVAYIVFGAMGFVMGFFVDYLSDLLKTVSPQYKA